MVVRQLSILFFCKITSTIEYQSALQNQVLIMAQQVENGSNRIQDSSGYEIRVGDVVLVSGHRLAIIRFIGNVEFANGVWFGVELKGHRDLDYGCDGTKNGKRYFVTKHNKAGLFVQKIIRVIPPEELLHKVAELNEKLLLCTCGANEVNPNSPTNTNNNRTNNKSKSKSKSGRRQNTYGGQIDYNPSSSEEDA